MGKLDGKVAFITGAARGQGRSHAVRLAQEGADVIAVDLCAQMDTIGYPMATPDDLAETVRAVEALDRRIVARQADVRDVAALRSAVEDGVAELGRVDIVLANAGISAAGSPEPSPERTWDDVIGVNLTGVWNTVHVAAPRMIEQGEGGSIVLTSSTQGLTGRGGDGSAAVTAYAASKHGVVGLMRSFAHWLAPHRIRVNCVHPTGAATPMVENEVLQNWLAANEESAGMLANLMPVELIEAVDVSNAIAWLVSDEGRYVTGVPLPVDAGFTVR
ncbi:mycofactocin-coupled SDR family oxidoreductase [Geodermatophilus sp. SYSU D00703]